MWHPAIPVYISKHTHTHMCTHTSTHAKHTHTHTKQSQTTSDQTQYILPKIISCFELLKYHKIKRNKLLNYLTLTLITAQFLPYSLHNVQEERGPPLKIVNHIWQFHTHNASHLAVSYNPMLTGVSYKHFQKKKLVTVLEGKYLILHTGLPKSPRSLTLSAPSMATKIFLDPLPATGWLQKSLSSSVYKYNPNAPLTNG